MVFLILRLLGSNTLLNEKQKAFLEVVVKYFYIRFMLQYHHSMARETALLSIDDEYKDFSDVERAQLIQEVKVKFDIADDKVEKVVEDSLSAFADLLALVVRIINIVKFARAK